MDVDRGIVFAEREGFRALELDVYLPDTTTAATTGPPPLLVYVHGGGWRVSHRSRAPRETRAWTTGFFERLTDAGLAVAAISYRFSGEARFPAQIDDVLAGIAWLQANSGDLGVDAGRTVVWGMSGGGHLAALAGLTEGAPPVAAVVCWYPITDLTALDQDNPDMFEAHLLGGPIGQRVDAARAASPVAHVHPGAPPFLLQHGDKDTWVPVDQSIRLADALRAAGNQVDLEIVPGADHFFDGYDDVEGIFTRARDFLLP